MQADPDLLQDLEAHRAALEHAHVIAIVNRRWKEPETLKYRAQRARDTLARVRPALTWITWKKRQDVISDAFCAWALSTGGRRHWLRKIIGDS